MTRTVGRLDPRAPRARLAPKHFTNAVEVRLRRRDDNFRWHLARAVPIKDADGRIARWIGTNTDIHDQKEAAATLEQRVEERTSQLMIADTSCASN